MRPLPKKIQIKQHPPPEEIRRLYKKEKDKKKAIRPLAIYLMKGKTPEELAEFLQVDVSTIYRLIQRRNEHGLSGLENNKEG